MEKALKKEIVLSRASVKAIGIFIFLILTALGAFVRIPLPFTPVPLTLQTMFVLLAGAFLGVSGVISCAAYIALGALGIPIFTNAGSGLLYVFGPTGGYLFGFVLAALFTGSFVNKSKSFFSAFIIMGIASMIILSCGTIWLGLFMAQPLKSAFAIGFLPFVPGDLLKALAATAVYRNMTPRAIGTFAYRMQSAPPVGRGAGVPPSWGRRQKCM